MRDMDRLNKSQQFSLSRGQLGALAVSTLSVAVLGFFVGLMVGRSPAGDESPLDAGAVTASRLIEPEVEQDALLDLLARVEDAAARHMPEAEAAPLSYPERLLADEADGTVPDKEEPEPEPDAEPVVVEPDDLVDPEPPLPPAEPAGFQVPSAGWAVQVAAYTSAEEADVRVHELQAQGLEAWRAEALVKGRTWYRVRIGAHKNRAAAQEAARELSDVLGTTDLMVAKIDG